MANTNTQTANANEYGTIVIRYEIDTPLKNGCPNMGWITCTPSNDFFKSFKTMDEDQQKEKAYEIITTFNCFAPDDFEDIPESTQRFFDYLKKEGCVMFNVYEKSEDDIMSWEDDDFDEGRLDCSLHVASLVSEYLKHYNEVNGTEWTIQDYVKGVKMTYHDGD